MTSRPISRRRPHKEPSASTSGLAIPGACFSRTRKTSRPSAPPNWVTWPDCRTEFEKRNCKIIGLSVDPVADHGKWAADIEKSQGHKVNYPMIGDSDLKVAKLYGMLPAEAGETCAGRTAANNATVRTVFVIGPDKKIKLMLIYPMTTGRNFDEVLRVLDSMQLTAKHQVATPVNWKPGNDVIIVPAVSDEEAKQEIPGRLESRSCRICVWWRSRSRPATVRL